MHGTVPCKRRATASVVQQTATAGSAFRPDSMRHFLNCCPVLASQESQTSHPGPGRHRAIPARSQWPKPPRTSCGNAHAAARTSPAAPYQLPANRLSTDVYAVVFRRSPHISLADQVLPTKPTMVGSLPMRCGVPGTASCDFSAWALSRSTSFETSNNSSRTLSLLRNVHPRRPARY
ncbi:hypothetical protein N658DRAFT_6736 [Parathielavia hyrcaniae]|uniref:Uncharacterized protein n=1 Tax=Parathielavia hyrcaniae TaxID=113614 RepID=A0AAN6Q9J7_9PEZI|nr:hypothetical protein N658DRAFT_6736 [Parathielavia hyrcaniae]